MKKLILTLLVLLSLMVLPTFAQQRRGKGRTLTTVAAQRLLNQKINEPSVNNMLLTCRACYSDEDKGENENFSVVSSYSNISQLLARQGYIRVGRNGEYFTAKAKRSTYFEAYGDGYGGFGGAGFRFANFKNPKITIKKITDLKNVPIEYDVVPTAVTKDFLGATKRVQATASFSYGDGRWSVCIGCSN